MIIGLVGKAGAGKDTVAGYVAEATGAATLSLAAPLKEFCRHVFDFTEAQLYGPSENRNAPDPRYPRPASLGGPACLTPRFALQTLGTDWGRVAYPNVWIDLGIRRARELLAAVDYTPTGPRPRHPYVAISDVRFTNEARAIRAAGGEVWRIVRPGITAELGGVAGHASEAEQDSEAMSELVNRNIWNHSGLDELRAQVRAILANVPLAGRAA